MRFPSPNDDLSHIWRLLVVRAAIVLVLSAAALPWPIVSLGVMLMLVSGIAVAAGVLDAAMSGALQRHMASSWALLPEAVVGIVLGAGVLLYPLVPLTPIGALVALWMVSRGIMLAAIARSAASDTMLRVVTSGWAVASVLGPAIMIAHWDEASIVPVVKLLVAYALLWSALELVVGLHLRGRVGVPEHGAAAH
ncbi:MAG TPA: hypothetical protein VFW03_19685 [Gemmatimonadaceae bacterium]|nr:hypothetical protein [Gemmatimonadaceae bacterium]